MGRQLRSSLDLLKPNVMAKVHNKQEKQKTTYDAHTKERSIGLKDPVFMKNFSSGQKWLPGIVCATQGCQMVGVKLQDSRVVRRHLDHVRYRASRLPDDESEDTDEDLWISPQGAAAETPVHPVVPTPPFVPRRSTRPHRPPARFLHDPVFN